MELEELLAQIPQLTNEELMRLYQAADQELQERHYQQREIQTMKTLGLSPLYRCQDPEHQSYGLYGEDFNRPGYLVCGCPKAQAQFVGYE
jgi:hypothetical protein